MVVAAVILKCPPLKIRLPVPRLASLAIASVPLVIVTEPEYVLLPESVSVPLPSFIQ